MTIEIITGNIFDSNEQYICHQANCISKKAAYLAKDLFDKYPYADIYVGRSEADKPGNIVIKGNGEDKRYVIALLAQYYPGKPKFPESNLDGIKIREKYFYQCLLRIAKIENLKSIAFPWRVGCGVAGGNWENYLGTLSNFAQHVNAVKGTKVVMYKREFDE